MSTGALSRDLVTRDPAIHHGDPVFAGTRVPVQTLVDCLEDGYDVQEFLNDFPTLKREQVRAALELLRAALLSA